MRIKPFEDRVLVEPEEVTESKTKSGIILPDTAKEKPKRGKVVEARTDEEFAGKSVFRLQSRTILRVAYARQL